MKINYEALLRIMGITWTQAEDDKLADLARLKAINNKLGRIYTNQCNGYEKQGFKNGHWVGLGVTDHEWEAKEAAQEIKLIEKAQAIANKNVWQIRIQSDPRGSAIKLNLVPGSSDIEYTGTDTDLI